MCTHSSAFISDHRSALSPIIIMAAVITLFAFFVPTHQARIENALCPSARFVPTFVSSFFSNGCIHTAIKAAHVSYPVHRIDLELLIYELVAESGDFVVVEGAERMGKSTLVQNVSATLSLTRTVRSINCSSSTTGKRALSMPFVFVSWHWFVSGPCSGRCTCRALHAPRRLRD